ncbi:MAG TPA: tetratricopeptide repeat protein [Candidatus Acidoferrales bacterium]|nr:tetratricopeptide repeat protein [Candidatus Acidoferrales bacterium]
MSQDVTKYLERARKHLEKNKLQDAIADYQAALEAFPNHPEATQMLADLYVRSGDLVQAAYYYGLQFDRLAESGDMVRATAIFTRHLKSYPQPGHRLVRYAFLLQKQNRTTEAIECYVAAAQKFGDQNDWKSQFECLQRVAHLDPENADRQTQLANLAEKLGNAETAGRAYLRGGQLAQAAGEYDRALELFSHAHRITPGDRSVTLLFADARLHRGDAAGAVALLQPFAPADPADTAFLTTFGEALLLTNQLDSARDVLFALCKQKPEGFDMLFQLAERYIEAGKEEQAVSVLDQAKEWMLAIRNESIFATRLDMIVEAHPKCLPLIQFWAKVYDQLNREVKYFDALVRLFDVSLACNKIDAACDALDRLVEIDPYDYRIHERISKLEGKASPAFLRNISVRAAKASGGPQGTQATGGTGLGLGDSVRAQASEEESAGEKVQRAIDDLIVQAEIFLQYSLQSKAVERLERIAELYPGQEEKNDRLRLLYERANWWPKGSTARTQASAAAPTQGAVLPISAVSAAAAADTHRDLAEIAEITRLMYREVTPREVLGTAVREIGKYLNVRRCIAVVGAPGKAAPIVSEFSPSGLKAAAAAAVAKVAARLAKASPDAVGGISMTVSEFSEMRALEVETILGVPLTDKDTQSAAGVLFLGDTVSRQWKPNESFFLQAIGDQIMISVNHTRLRSLVRTLAVADEKTGLLGRGAYIDCLLAESKRSRMQGTPLTLIILQMDHGPELLRQEGDGVLEAYLNQLARSLEPSIRQGDLAVKYTTWSLAFVLPDTPRENAEALAAKLRLAAAQVQPNWASSPITFSAVVADAAARASDENEDRVTEWINRAESGLDETRHRGGNTLVTLAAPQPA